jgi:hypothetical protein
MCLQQRKRKHEKTVEASSGTDPLSTRDVYAKREMTKVRRVGQDNNTLPCRAPPEQLTMGQLLEFILTHEESFKRCVKFESVALRYLSNPRIDSVSGPPHILES